MSFPRYPAYKASGVEWLGEVPAHWGMSKLKHAATFASGGTPSKAVLEYWDGDVPWASSKDLKRDAIADTEDHITERAIADGVRLVNPGDLMVVVRGMILAHTFPVTKALRPMAINQDLKAIRPHSNWAVDYFAALLRASTMETFRRLDEAGHGTKALRMDAWLGLEIPMPPLAEQTAIAAFLDRETARIDALVAEQERLIALLKEKRQAVISHAVTKGLDPQAPMKNSGVEWLGEVPAHWEIWKLAHAFEIIGSGTTPNTDSREYYDEGDIPWVNTGDLADGYLATCSKQVTARAVTEHTSLKLYPAGSLVIAMYGATIGKLAKLGFPATVNQACCVFAGSSPIASAYLFYWFLGFRPQIVSMATGGGQPNISQDVLRKLRVGCPKKEEQGQIVAHLDRETARIDALVIEAQHAIDLLQERRTALISAAVTGQIDVRGLA